MTTTSRPLVSRRRSTGWGLILLAVLALVLAGCGRTPGPAAGSVDDSLRGKRVALVSCGDFNRWCSVMNHGIIDYLAARGARVTYLETNFDAAAQVQQFNQVLSQSPNLILLYAADAHSAVPALRRAQARGVPVINLVSAPAPESVPYFTSSVVVGAVALGRNAGLNLVEGLKAAGVTSGNVIAVTGTSSTIEVPLRLQGFMSVLKDYPQYPVVETVDANWDPQKAAQLSQQLLAKYAGRGGIAGGFGMSDDLANAIIETAKQSGVQVGAGRRGLVVVSSNCYKVGIDNIAAGDQYGTSTESPSRYSAFAQALIGRFLTQGSIPKDNVQDEVRITRDNLDQWRGVCSVI